MWSIQGGFQLPVNIEVKLDFIIKMIKIKVLTLMLLVLFLISCNPEQTSNDGVTSGMPVPNQEDIPEMIVEKEPAQKETIPKKPTPVEDEKQPAIEFDIIAKKWDFIPSEITVNQGDTVILHITSTDVKHGIGFPAFGINENLNPGETVDIEFVADKKGNFPFFCSVQCGSGHSHMTGILIVK